MKRLVTVLGVIAFAVALSFISYVKGHFNGVRQSSVSSLYLDTVVFDDFAKSGPERAKSRLGMIITTRFDTLNSGLTWIQSWRNWLKVDTEKHYERTRVRATEIAAQARPSLPTLPALKAALEEAHPDLKIEFKTN